ARDAGLLQGAGDVRQDDAIGSGAGDIADGDGSAGFAAGELDEGRRGDGARQRLGYGVVGGIGGASEAGFEDRGAPVVRKLDWGAGAVEGEVKSHGWFGCGRLG